MEREHRKVYEVRWYRDLSSLHHRLFLYIGGIKMIISILLLIVGFVLLIKGADIFVDGASSTALNLKVSKMVIGLTIVAFGTSAPEFAVSIKALLSGSSDIV